MGLEDQRDIRSAHRDLKRFRDSTTKWSHGSRPSAGCTLDWQTMDAVGGSENQRVKTRPRGKESEISHHKKFHQNITKGRTCFDQPIKRVTGAVNARDEIQDSAMSRSLLELVGPYGQRRMSLSDGFAYSFDRTESPNRPQSLDIYVKTTNGERDTERLVQREYEILDNNGQALRGKQARRDLRKATSNADMSAAVDEDGFELI